MVVGLLAILKAGGVYVPLDADSPVERISMMLEDVELNVLLSVGQALPSPQPRTKVIDLVVERQRIEEQPTNAPNITLSPDAAAYLVFTSGSTGQPKAVLGHHQGVVNYLSFLSNTYALDERDVVLQLPSLGFDASIRDLIGPLTVGARVILIHKSVTQDALALVRKIDECRVTGLLSLVPSMLNALIETGHRCDSVRLVLVSGEQLSVAACREAKELFGPNVMIVNQYGPTECTMTSSFNANTLNGQNGVALIGRPIANCRIYVLDEYRNAVPVGVPGELYIGGHGVTYGYYNDPTTTHERFVHEPVRSRKIFEPETSDGFLRTGNFLSWVERTNR
ncbi:MAG: AMP-binding protein [Caldilineaceae bacterium]|nr:AMP-binding protein [Caldilineaceae bacterium]